MQGLWTEVEMYNITMRQLRAHCPHWRLHQAASFQTLSEYLKMLFTQHAFIKQSSHDVTWILESARGPPAVIHAMASGNN